MPGAELDAIVTSVFTGLLGFFIKSLYNKASGIVYLQTYRLTLYRRNKKGDSFDMLMSDICFATILENFD